MMRARRIEVPRWLGSITSQRAIAPCVLREVGVTPEGCEAIWRAVERLYGTGLHPAISLCIRRQGQVVLDRALGHARGHGPQDGPGTERRPATLDTPFGLFSASKAVTAMVVHLLDERGTLRLDAPVAEYLPAFGQHNKGWITVRHVLTHRAGLPSVPGSQQDPELLLDPEACVARLCEAKAAHAPGRRLAYHALSGGYLLGAVVQTATGRTLQEVLRSEILDPLGFEGMGYGVPAHRESAVALNYVTGRAMPPPVGWLSRRALGLTWDQATELSNDPRFYRRVIPSANVFGTANEVSRFFQILLQDGELDGIRVMQRRTVLRAKSESAYLELDRVLMFPVRYGQGLILGAPLISPFGPGLRRAFGHIGFMNVFCYADPERQIAVGLMTTGKLLFDSHLPWLVDVLDRIGKHCPPLPRAGR